jgi:hypothetical protein
LVASVHRHDLDIYGYLEDVIRHMNRGTAKPEDLLPENSRKSDPESIREYPAEERRDKAELARMRRLNRKAGVLNHPADGVAVPRRTQGLCTLTLERFFRKGSAACKFDFL